MPLHVACRADDADKHENDVNQVIFHKGKLYSAGDDGKVKVWAPDLKLLNTVQAHPSSVYSLTGSDDTLFTCSNDGTVRCWELDTLKEKQTLLKDEEVEFWKVKFSNGVLYVGDDQGNTRIFKNGSLFYGSINVAIPVKDMTIKDNLLFSSKDNDVIVTDLHLGGEKPQFGIKATIVGRGPLALVENKVIFFSRDGKDILVNDLDEKQHLKETAKITGAHEMIINAAGAANWDGNCLLFTAGWDKILKQWKIEKDSLKADGTCSIDFVVNSLALGEKGEIYIGGSDGHIARINM